MQQTLVLIKPDGMQRRLAGEVLARFERKGLRLAGAKLLQPSRELAGQHYLVHKGKHFYESLNVMLAARDPQIAMHINLDLFRQLAAQRDARGKLRHPTLARSLLSTAA